MHEDAPNNGGSLDEHPLLLRLISRLPDKDELDDVDMWESLTSGAQGSAQPYEWTRAKLYSAQIFRITSSALHTLRRMHLAEVLMELRPPTSKSTTKIERLRWLEYHYTTHVLAQATLDDVALRMVSEVFDLGLVGRSRTATAVLDNRHVKGTRSYVAMKELSKLVQPVRKFRNDTVHEGKKVDLATAIDDDDYGLVEFHSLLAELTGSPAIRQHEYWQMTRKKADSTTKACEAARLAITEKLRTLMTELQKEYEVRFQYFQKYGILVPMVKP